MEAQRVEIGVGPQVTNLVGLARLGHPQADDLGIFLVDLERSGEQVHAFPGGARPGALAAQLVDVGRLGRRGRGSDGVEEANVPAHDVAVDEGFYLQYQRWFLASSPPNYGDSAPSNVAATALPTLSGILSGIGAGACTAV